MFDLTIKNCIIYDGTGGKPYTGNIGIKDQKIACISKEHLESYHTYDAKYLTVTPGFVDIHTHTDHSAFLDNRQESQIRQGITTEVGGLCGLSVTPCSDKTREKVSGFFNSKTKL